MQLSRNKVHFGTAGAAVHIVDVEKREYRDSVLTDLYDAARIVQTLDNVHFFQRPLVARDMEDPLDLDINTLYAAIKGTTKHVGTSFTVGENVDACLDLLYTAAEARPLFGSGPLFRIPTASWCRR